MADFISDHPIVASIASAIITGVAIVLFRRKLNHLDKKKEELETIKNDIAALKKSLWRTNKTLIILAKLTDAWNAKTHPELISDLENITDELIKDEHED